MRKYFKKSLIKSLMRLNRRKVIDSLKKSDNDVSIPNMNTPQFSDSIENISIPEKSPSPGDKDSNQKISHMYDTNMNMKGFGYYDKINLNHETTHPFINRMATLEHAPLNINISKLKQPSITGLTKVAGTHTESGKNYFIKDGGDEHNQEDPGVNEIVVPHLSKYFGISHMVPKVKLHTVPGKGHLIVQENLDNHVSYNHQDPYNVNYVRGLMISGNKGDLAKAAVMNYLTGNTDRHRCNFMVHPTEGVKLIDHGRAFTEPKETNIKARYLELNPVASSNIPIDLEKYINSLPIEQMDNDLEHLKGMNLIDKNFSIEQRKNMLLNNLKNYGNIKTHGDLFNALKGDVRKPDEEEYLGKAFNPLTVNQRAGKGVNEATFGLGEAIKENNMPTDIPETGKGDAFAIPKKRNIDTLRLLNRFKEENKKQDFTNADIVNLNNDTAHKSVKHLDSFDHPPLSISIANLKKPATPGITKVVGTHTENGKNYFVKNAADEKTGNEDMGVREAIVPHLSKYFGISHMVPKVKLHTVPGKGHLTVQENLDNHLSHNQAFFSDQNGDKGYKRDFTSGILSSANKGDLAKAAVMNYLVANLDRHHGNYMVHPTEGLKLVDHGFTLADPSVKNINASYLANKSVQNIDIPINLKEYINNLPIEQMDRDIAPMKREGYIPSDFSFEKRRNMLLDKLDSSKEVKNHADLFSTLVGLREPAWDEPIITPNIEDNSIIKKLRNLLNKSKNRVILPTNKDLSIPTKDIKNDNNI